MMITDEEYCDETEQTPISRLKGSKNFVSERE